MVGDQFAAWVKERIEARNVKVTVSKNLNIALDPEVAEAFQKSTAVSRTLTIHAILIAVSLNLIDRILFKPIVQNGAATTLLKVNIPRRRTHKEVAAAKAAEEEEKQMIKAKMARIDALEAQVSQMAKLQEDHNTAWSVLERLEQAGKIIIGENNVVSILGGDEQEQND